MSISMEMFCWLHYPLHKKENVFLQRSRYISPAYIKLKIITASTVVWPVNVLSRGHICENCKNLDTVLGLKPVSNLSESVHV